MSSARELLASLLRHQRWADEQTFAALCAPKGVPSVAQERFMHVVAAEHVWIRRLRGEKPTVAVWPPWTQDGCARLMAQNHREYATLVESDDAQLEREIAYTTSDGRPFRNTVRDVLLHVALHGSWHRGQVATLLRQAGVPPVPTDYIAWVRGAPAARTQPLE
jgi:uncharacterized damage-inducible protein DinB